MRSGNRPALAMDDGRMTIPALSLSAPSPSRSFGTAGREALEMLARVEQWSTLAWNDIKLRYRRTTLGPLWITLGLSATVLSVGILYGVLFGNELSEYLPYFTVGLVTWTFLASAITDGCAVFLGAAALIRAIPVPLVVHAYRMLARQLLVLAHNFLLIVGLWLILRWPLDANVLLVMPALALNVIVVIGLALFFGIVAARFRDVQLIVSMLLQLLFIMTPIMWQTKSLKGSAVSYVVDFNPVYHLIEIIRGPLLNQAPSSTSWAISAVVAAGSFALGMAFYARYRHRVPFWV
jgi:ABC-type polysaccharide/polyol phosphate export permease